MTDPTNQPIVRQRPVGWRQIDRWPWKRAKTRLRRCTWGATDRCVLFVIIMAPSYCDDNAWVRRQMYGDWLKTMSKLTTTCTSKTSFRDVGDQRSAITLLKTYESTKRASIQTRREEIDYGEHDSHVSMKSMFCNMTLTRILPNSLKNIWIDQTCFNTNPKGGNWLRRTR